MKILLWWLWFNLALVLVIWAIMAWLIGYPAFPWIGAILVFVLQACPGSGTWEAARRMTR